MTREEFTNILSQQADGDGRAMGKPYSWQLSHREDVAYLALPPQVLVQRVLARTETFNEALKRTAAFLVVVSRNNGYEGRDPLVVLDDVRSGTAAQFLNIDIDLLGHALAEMQRRGLVSAMDDGNLHLDDIRALDSLSESQSSDR